MRKEPPLLDGGWIESRDSLGSDLGGVGRNFKGCLWMLGTGAGVVDAWGERVEEIGRPWT